MHCYCHLQREGSAAVAACGLAVLRTRCVCVMRYLQVNRQARKTKDITYLCVRLLSSSSSYSGHRQQWAWNMFKLNFSKGFLIEILELPARFACFLLQKYFYQVIYAMFLLSHCACVRCLPEKACDKMMRLPSFTLSLPHRINYKDNSERAPRVARLP